MIEAQTFDVTGFLKRVSTRPGVYRMLDDEGEILYVGKAGNLRKRLSGHFRRSSTTSRASAGMGSRTDVERLTRPSPKRTTVLRPRTNRTGNVRPSIGGSPGCQSMATTNSV